MPSPEPASTTLAPTLARVEQISFKRRAREDVMEMKRPTGDELLGGGPSGSHPLYALDREPDDDWARDGLGYTLGPRRSQDRRR